MACRVGMSSDPQERIKHWKKEEGHTHSRILASGLTYDGALATEAKEAKAKGCRQSPGGLRKSGRVYSVYHVWGGK